MKFIELGDSINRFRFAQSGLGLAGCLCVCYAVWSPSWFQEKGLWSTWNSSSSDQTTRTDDAAFSVLEAERVFGIISFLMAVSTGALCLVFALCWTSQTVRSYSNTRSLLMAGQALYPTNLLLFTMAPTGFFFLLSWSFFTYQHHEEICQDFSSLGSSYWLGALGWALLLIVESVVYIVEQAVVPDVIPGLQKDVESWRLSSHIKDTKRAFSANWHPAGHKSHFALPRYLSMP